MAEVLEYPFGRTGGLGLGLAQQGQTEAGTSACECQGMQHQHQTQQRVGFKRGRAPLQAHDLDLRANCIAASHSPHQQTFKRGRVDHVAAADHEHEYKFIEAQKQPSHAGEFQKENQILKKAVAIQNEKLRTEKESTAGLREALAAAQQQVRHLLRAKEENQALRVALSHAQEQARQLEIENYSLKVHLKQMNSCATLSPTTQPNRDIF
ncbi:hypothetical protein HOP50_10g61090 [Chloropicon primus]|uniref:Uncharacterized protein n=1 Tax=Chloropicon primus TaxID=1764295 RepID=A0A5B8MVT4_9CHLO|nr:hypothetical protein A3770_10p60880 [Chloropicon primus]UPR02782.1 hypothetical protein HOP50_10g61090 [Chloropicon primus]|mmetsp:Transcript_13300/g.37322  ORF Transcript_13300/g.37322 Transcript_13300/m.37322 type:complete len:209 (+) Transcript_13300:336-962(+)|eukprot:QDZ23570.1 hypothetical protein A3770_10p60880 [Chloropicon primus]